MNDRQERFCIEYARCGNGAEAYRRAGYVAKNDHVASTNAAKLMAHNSIKERIRELTAEIRDETIADIKEIQRFLTSVVRGEAPENRVVHGDDGYDIVEVVSQPNQIKSAELLAKMQGGFVNTVDIKADSPVVVIVDDLDGD